MTLWYGTILGAALIVAAALAWLSMRASVYTAIDRDLRARAMAAKQQFDETLRQHGETDLPAHLLEHAVGEAWQIRSSEGVWIYRAAVARQNAIPLDVTLPGQTDPVLRTIRVGRSRYRTAQLVTKPDSKPNTYTLQLVEPLDLVDGALARFAQAMALATPVLLALACVGGYWISGRALRPVDLISRAADAMTERSLSDRIPVPTAHDELHRLANTLNRMLDRLEQAFWRLNDFTADASHELRTPVAFIRATTEILLRRSRSEQEWRAGVRDVHVASIQMTDLIDALLTLARADAGAERLELVSIDLDRVVATALEKTGPVAIGKRLVLTGPTKPVGAVVYGEPALLERVLLILLDNAIKYTPQGGTVSVVTNRAGHFVVVSVCDTGLGIPEEDQRDIFERFYRSDKVRSRGVGGFGLGLSIARWIAERHHGTIEVASTLGIGSEFRFRLPLAGDH